MILKSQKNEATHCELDKLNNFKAKILKQMDLVAERESYTEIISKKAKNSGQNGSNVN